ncbi:hypothetical protein ALI22I_20250 [Saccharothrix sp. ALI-22-I]|uniref:hypothetical protein n=1 Tax=Saccharothrix sp. ALI-22-I TaxID=1933778 RepID=UPI00097C22FD|nr:hypothetical protein [Saccharothrix sp. ALI-22-I]ONI88074.1 hypothetical protein ALI22I_20250 [Saccharothrix sp. ALI-22-I]
MPVTAEDLCAFLLDLDAPDRLARPLLLDPGVVWAGVAQLSEALGAAFGRRCAVERLPEGGEHHGSITVPGEATSAGAPVVLVVGRYGLTVALSPNHWNPDGSSTILLDDDDFARTKETVFATGFGLTSPVSALTPWRAERPYPRLLSARTAGELVRQIRNLPTDGGPTAELREWLCATLDVPADGPADERPASLDVLTPEQVLAEVERIRLCVGVLSTPKGSDERRWPVIDDTIVDGHTMWAIMAFRNEFGEGLKEAILAVHERADILRRTRPHGYVAGRGRDAA